MYICILLSLLIYRCLFFPMLPFLPVPVVFAFVLPIAFGYLPDFIVPVEEEKDDDELLEFL